MDSDRLSGWKEIAAHLRRSVRAAQRWEHELGLPVKRVKTVAGQVVFASRAELDAWLAQQQSVIHSLPVDPADADQAEVELDVDMPVVEQSPSRVWQPERRSRRPLLAIAAAAIVIVALGAWAWWPSVAAPMVHSVTIAGKVLHARGADGRVL